MAHRLAAVRGGPVALARPEGTCTAGRLRAARLSRLAGSAVVQPRLDVRDEGPAHVRGRPLALPHGALGAGRIPALGRPQIDPGLGGARWGFEKGTGAPGRAPAPEAGQQPL